jgi:hypothetical protein
MRYLMVDADSGTTSRRLHQSVQFDGVIHDLLAVKNVLLTECWFEGALLWGGQKDVKLPRAVFS